MKVYQVLAEEYQKILDDYPADYNFFQSADYIRMQQKKGRKATTYIGEVDGKPVIAINVILLPGLKVFETASSPREWLILTPDGKLSFDLLKEFIQQVKKSLKKQDCIFWSLESGVEIHQLDKEGQIKEDGFDNSGYRKMIQNLGFIPRHLWSNGYFMGKQARIVSMIHLDDSLQNGYPLSKEQLDQRKMKTMDDLLADMPGNQRRRMKENPHVLLKNTGMDGIDDFMACAEYSGAIHHFEIPSRSMIQGWLEGYGKQASLHMAYLDLAGMIKENQEVYKAAQKEYEANRMILEENPKLKKKRTAMNLAREAMETAQKRIEQIDVIREKYDPKHTGKPIPAAGGLFIKTPTETVYLFGGSRRDLAMFNASYLLQKQMMEEAIRDKKSRYNFWGISGNYQPDEIGYGVYHFKSLLGGIPAEYSGEFTCNLHPVAGKLFEMNLEKHQLLERREIL